MDLSQVKYHIEFNSNENPQLSKPFNEVLSTEHFFVVSSAEHSVCG